jgi:hypothetical protein
MHSRIAVAREWSAYFSNVPFAVREREDAVAPRTVLEVATPPLGRGWNTVTVRKASAR